MNTIKMLLEINAIQQAKIELEKQDADRPEFKNRDKMQRLKDKKQELEDLAQSKDPIDRKIAQLRKQLAQLERQKQLQKAGV